MRPSRQSPESVTEAARLDRLLDALMAPPSDSVLRTVVPRGSLGLVGGLLDLIDHTIIARQMVVTNSEGHHLTMDICNRRLLQICTEDGEGALKTMSARDLTYAGGVDMEELRELFTSFAAFGPLVIETLPSSGAAGLEDSGIAADTLRAHWDTPAPAIAAPGALHTFCADYVPEDAAWLFDDGGESDDGAASGPDAMVEALIALHGDLDLDLLDPDAPHCLRIFGNGAQIVVILRDGAALACVLGSAEILPDLIGHLPAHMVPLGASSAAETAA